MSKLCAAAAISPLLLVFIVVAASTLNKEVKTFGSNLPPAQQLIEGLRYFAEIKGAYPKELSIIEIVGEIDELVKEKPVAINDDKVSDLKFGAKFFSELDPSQNPTYNSEVEPGDAFSVLVEWTKDGKPHTIYGDLRSE